jgi:uncharacterized protein (UPF0248 family)
MVYPREILNRLKWTKGESLHDAMIWYVHRGAPGDLIGISGDCILSLGKGFFETDDATIPYHRIILIEYKGKAIFEKKKAASKPKKSR